MPRGPDMARTLSLRLFLAAIWFRIRNTARRHNHSCDTHNLLPRISNLFKTTPTICARAKCSRFNAALTYSSSCFARAEHEQRARPNARKQRRISQAQDRRRINDNNIEILAGAGQQSRHILAG